VKGDFELATVTEYSKETLLFSKARQIQQFSYWIKMRKRNWWKRARWVVTTNSAFSVWIAEEWRICCQMGALTAVAAPIQKVESDSSIW